MKIFAFITRHIRHFIVGAIGILVVSFALMTPMFGILWCQEHNHPLGVLLIITCSIGFAGGALYSWYKGA